MPFATFALLITDGLRSAAMSRLRRAVSEAFVIMIDMPPSQRRSADVVTQRVYGRLDYAPGDVRALPAGTSGGSRRRHMESSDLPAGEEGSHSGLVRRS